MSARLKTMRWPSGSRRTTRHRPGSMSVPSVRRFGHAARAAVRRAVRHRGVRSRCARGGRRGPGTTSGSGSPLGSVTTGRCGGRGGPSPGGGGGGGSSAESQLTSGPSMRMRSGRRCVSRRGALDVGRRADLGRQRVGVVHHQRAQVLVPAAALHHVHAQHERGGHGQRQHEEQAHQARAQRGKRARQRGAARGVAHACAPANA